MKINNNIKKGEGKRSGTVGIHTFEEEKKKNNLIALCLLRLGNPTGYSAFGRYTIFWGGKSSARKKKKNKSEKEASCPLYFPSAEYRKRDARWMRAKYGTPVWELTPVTGAISWLPQGKAVPTAITAATATDFCRLSESSSRRWKVKV